MTAHAHGDHHGSDHHGDAHAHGSFRSYMIGFLLSVVLTAVPFWLVMGEVMDPSLTTVAILGLGVVQIVVHMVYFLHMNSRSENGWTMLALIFTLILVVITLTGSLWVMYHLNANMMPVHDMSRMP
ncbi:cytochrome o ubiquinol oxidase subunit IV [Azospirillum thermophilum]|uniref:Cytochrome bo(3) ubiquinol oxidase subunit 4 n=1 Tax=Azospirillum thermophilum TaxID=2202148 RepID=A0A2S2CXT5_9PROT|nr:cytochrome o ubiquinol oxidase subunit IV [Azospirillum thermophilum]AWK89332.1 cytochrome o ubiquinol oxidase subunit IV [Azospirillum thermophilum]